MVVRLMHSVHLLVGNPRRLRTRDCTTGRSDGITDDASTNILPSAESSKPGTISAQEVLLQGQTVLVRGLGVVETLRPELEGLNSLVDVWNQVYVRQRDIDVPAARATFALAAATGT